MESNDSPEIPDMGETSDISGLPSGGLKQQMGTSLFSDKYFQLSNSDMWREGE